MSRAGVDLPEITSPRGALAAAKIASWVAPSCLTSSAATAALRLAAGLRGKAAAATREMLHLECVAALAVRRLKLLDGDVAQNTRRHQRHRHHEGDDNPAQAPSRRRRLSA